MESTDIMEMRKLNALERSSFLNIILDLIEYWFAMHANNGEEYMTENKEL